MNKTDPTGKIVSAVDKNEQASLAQLINKNARGTYKFDSSGNLMKVSSSGKASSYYAGKLDAAIANKSTISLDVASTVTHPQTGQALSVDKDLGGGATIGSQNGGNQAVTISGNPLTTLKDTGGNTLKDAPADILMHEIVGHAAPHILGSDTGNAVGNENKARSELPGGRSVRPSRGTLNERVMNMFPTKLAPYAFGLAVLMPQIASANSVQSYTLEKKVAQSDVVFSGHIGMGYDSKVMNDKFVTIQVDDVLKGTPGRSVLLLLRGDISELNPRCCDEGTTYLFFLKRIEGNKYAPVNGPFGVHELNVRK
jgi:hypothetical protein